MIKFLKNFHANGNGAVTIDWVVLIAAVVGLAIAILSSLAASRAEIGGYFGYDISTQAHNTH